MLYGKNVVFLNHVILRYKVVSVGRQIRSIKTLTTRIKFPCWLRVDLMHLNMFYARIALSRQCERQIDIGYQSLVSQLPRHYHLAQPNYNRIYPFKNILFKNRMQRKAYNEHY